MRAVRCVAAALMLWAAAAGIAAAEQESTASVTDIRAAFVYNFAKFTEWPDGVIPPRAPIVLCVVENRAVADALTQIVRGHTAGNRGLAVRLLRDGEPPRACHLLYAPQLDAERAAALLMAVAGMPLLTISDYDRFAEMGGVANFTVEGGKMRFVVNVDAAQRARLQVSSQLLTLAKIARDGDAR